MNERQELTEKKRIKLKNVYIYSLVFFVNKKDIVEIWEKKVAFRFSSPRKAVVRPWPYQSVFCIADYQMRNVNVRSVNSKRRKTPSSSCLWVSQFRCFVTNSTYDNYTVLYKPDYIVIILLYYIILYIYIYDVVVMDRDVRWPLTLPLYIHIYPYIYTDIYSLYTLHTTYIQTFCVITHDTH